MNTRLFALPFLLASSLLWRGLPALGAPAKPPTKPAPKATVPKAKPPSLVLPVPGVAESTTDGAPVRIAPPAVKPKLFDTLELLVKPEAMPAGRLAYVCEGSIPGKRFVQFYLVIREFGPEVKPENALKIYHVQGGTTDEVYGSSFSPNGKSYLISVGWPWDAGASMRYYVFNLETQKLMALPADLYGSPRSWSPDSNFFAYIKGRELRVCDVRTGQSRLVVRHTGLVGSPIWTPLGMLLFTVERPQRATPDMGDGKPGVTASPRATGRAQPDIYEVNMVGGKPKLLIENGDRPLPSPDGQWIAFMGMPDPPADGSARPETKEENYRQLLLPRLLLFNRNESKRYPLNTNFYRQEITTDYIWASDSQDLFVMRTWYHVSKEEGAQGTGWLKQVDVAKRDVKDIITLKARDESPTDRDSGNQFVMRKVNNNDVSVRVSELGPPEENSHISSYFNSWVQVNTKVGGTITLFKFKAINGFDWHSADESLPY